ncbi:hypothetical protein [Actinomycetospora flava]|uniref:Uncharacterized protein n=1 Tax=Actinomycetospora flava TaxID=3129232 RepID=A0ABU8MAF1_9PSEU
MWHLHWRAEVARVESLRPEKAAVRTEKSTTAKASSFQRVWHDTPAATVAADVPESVRVRGR